MQRVQRNISFPAKEPSLLGPALPSGQVQGAAEESREVTDEDHVGEHRQGQAGNRLDTRVDDQGLGGARERQVQGPHACGWGLPRAVMHYNAVKIRTVRSISNIATPAETAEKASRYRTESTVDPRPLDISVAPSTPGVEGVDPRESQYQYAIQSRHIGCRDIDYFGEPHGPNQRVLGELVIVTQSLEALSTCRIAVFAESSKEFANVRARLRSSNDHVLGTLWTGNLWETFKLSLEEVCGSALFLGLKRGNFLHLLPVDDDHLDLDDDGEQERRRRPPL